MRVALLLLVCIAVTWGQMTTTDINNLMKAHNDKRTQYSSPNMVWNASLATDCQSWASACKFVHSLAPGVGENLACASTPTDVTAAVTMWNGEEKNYDCINNAANSTGATIGHFTQVIWSATTSCGCATAICPAGTIFPSMESMFTVCRYWPPGNYANQRPCPQSACVSSSSSSTTTTNPAPAPTTTTKPAPAPPTTTKPAPAPPTTTKPAPAPPTTTKPAPAPPTTTKPAPAPTPASSTWWTPCTANFNYKSVPCTGTPWLSSGAYYCPCGDPAGYSWGVTNMNKPGGCNPPAAATTDAEAQGPSMELSTGAWAGIGIAIVVVVVVVVVIVVVVAKRKNGERF